MAQFTDIVLKLVVIEELMYRRKALPRFELAEVERLTGKKLYVNANYVMPKDDPYGMMPEVRAYFEAYEIPEALLATIESLRWEGGDQIQCEVAPNWDGEDALFDLTAASAEDLHLLPNLKHVTALHTKDAVAAFAAKGIPLKDPYG